MPRETRYFTEANTISVSGGSGTATTPALNHMLKHIIVSPTTATTRYAVQIQDASSRIIWKNPGSRRTGRYSVTGLNTPLIGAITITLSSVSKDEDIEVYIAYE